MRYTIVITFQFTATAPSGIMSKQSFLETFENMVSVAFGMEQLPDVWMNITPMQVCFFFIYNFFHTLCYLKLLVVMLWSISKDYQRSEIEDLKDAQSLKSGTITQKNWKWNWPQHA